MPLSGYVLALFIGITLGMLGGGGSILTVPVFVYVLGYEPKLAIAMSLPVVGGASFLGAIGHWRAGNVRVRPALVFGSFTMIAAFGAARASSRMPDRVQLAIFGATMLIASVLMLRDSLKDPATAPAPAPAPEPETRRGWALMSLLGVLVGTLTGVIGIGGGFLIVPALVLLARLPMRQAVGTSLTVIAMTTAAAYAGQSGRGEIPWEFVILFGGTVTAGIIAGTRAVRYVGQRSLKRAFAVLLLVTAGAVLWRSGSFF